MTPDDGLPAANPLVSDADSFLDQQFTADHPGRRYHRRPGPDGSFWLIRRLGRAYLRALARTPLHRPDTDEAMRVAWFEAAWPELDKPTRDKLITAARTAERAMKATRRAPAAPTAPRAAVGDQTTSPLTAADHPPRAPAMSGAKENPATAEAVQPGLSQGARKPFDHKAFTT
jgi:hypothetical protein